MEMKYLTERVMSHFRNRVERIKMDQTRMMMETQNFADVVNDKLNNFITV